MTSIGYLIPEFPGQTHIFFWREREALQRIGIRADLVSTRQPPRGIVSHSWSAKAMAETEYLFPIRQPHAAMLVSELASAGHSAVQRIWSAICRAEGLSGKRRWRLAGLAVMGVRLAALARRHGWEHIHVHSCADAAHVALFAHLTSGVSYSITLHGPLDDYGPNQREKWRHAKFAIVITERLLHEVRERLSGALPDVVEVAPMGVDVETFSRRAPFVPFDGSGPLRLFSCGRLNPCKGHKYLIAAAKRLRDEGFQATLTIAGDDEAGGSGYRQVLEREIGALGMGEFVTLAGAVDEQRIIDELERAHVFSLASLAEPLGVAIMEAMAMELPVVATRSGGVAELITDGADGILVPPEDSSALAQAIVMLARDPARAQRMGQAARGKVIDRFQATRSAQLLSDNLDGHASRGAQQRGAA